MPSKVKRGERRLGTEVETAKILGVSPNTLKMARSTRTGDFSTLKWYKTGPFVRYISIICLRPGCPPASMAATSPRRRDRWPARPPHGMGQAAQHRFFRD